MYFYKIPSFFPVDLLLSCCLSYTTFSSIVITVELVHLTSVNIKFCITDKRVKSKDKNLEAWQMDLKKNKSTA